MSDLHRELETRGTRAAVYAAVALAFVFLMFGALCFVVGMTEGERHTRSASAIAPAAKRDLTGAGLMSGAANIGGSFVSSTKTDADFGLTACWLDDTSPNVIHIMLGPSCSVAFHKPFANMPRCSVEFVGVGVEDRYPRPEFRSSAFGIVLSNVAAGDVVTIDCRERDPDGNKIPSLVNGTAHSDVATFGQIATAGTTRSAGANTMTTVVVRVDHETIAQDPLGFISFMAQGASIITGIRSRWTSGSFCVLQVDDECVTRWEFKKP